MKADEGAPILRLEIETNQPLRARDVGRLMERLGIAHQAFQTDEIAEPGERETLRIHKVWTGSFIAEFIVVAAAFVVADEARERLVAFVIRLIRAAKVAGKILTGADEPDPRAKAEAEVIDAGRILVRTGGAARVVIYVHGDNENRLEIDAETAEAMEEIRQLAAAARAIRVKQAGRLRRLADDGDGRDDDAGAPAFGRIPEIRFASARVRGNWIVFDTRAPWSSKIITVRMPTFLSDRLFGQEAPPGGEPVSQDAAAVAHRDAIDRAFKRAWVRGEFEPDIDAPDDHFFVGLKVGDFQ